MSGKVRIRFVGGPLDDSVYEVRVGGKLRSLVPIKGLQSGPVAGTREGQYAALTVHRRNGENVPMADEQGNALYRWTGWSGQ